MIRSLTLLVLAWTILPGGNVSAANGDASTAPPDTFITGCELILFGNEVPPTTRAGRRGYQIVKTARTVVVNGVPFYSADNSSHAISVSPEMNRITDVIMAAAGLVRDSRDSKSGALTMNGEWYQVGDSFLIAVPGHDATAKITLAEGETFSVAYEGHELVFGAIVKPASRKETPLTPADAAYLDLLRNLRSGRLVVKGAGYTYWFTLSSATAVRASLAKIRTDARIERVDSIGVHYEPMTIDGYLWDSAVVRDFAESGVPR